MMCWATPGYVLLPSTVCCCDVCLQVNQDGAALAGRDLMNNLAELRKYQATRKFKAAANAVIAINRMNNMFKTDETKKAEPVEAAPAAAQES
jgi:hypothetical protein